MQTILSYHVYTTSYPTTAGFEGSRKTLHNARRLARALERQGFKPSILASVQDDSGRSWCEQVSL